MRNQGILLVALFLGACSSTPYGGFLTDYSKLEQSKNHPGAMTWQKPGVDLRVYDRLIIDPVVVIVEEDSKAAELGDDALRKVARGFSRILRETIEPYYTVVTEPGPTVLRLRVAITDVEPALERGDDSLGVSVGHAAMEAEMIDSATGEQLAAAVDRIAGSGAFKGEVPREWRHVEGAFVEWSNHILDYIDSHFAEEPAGESADEAAEEPAGESADEATEEPAGE